jgi:GGDEF domain-containing protein
MEERNQKQRITQHLQSTEVQQRILRDMQRAREEATVTISDAASLFGFTENQLRDWEKTGLLSPQRRMQDTEQDGKGPKRRQYTPTELDKLAIIRELMNVGISPGIIPTNVDKIWAEVATRAKTIGPLPEVSKREVEHVHIDSYAYVVYKELFWRYYSSQAMRFAIMLICEGTPPIPAGLILPANHQRDLLIKNVEDLQKLGKSLVGWLGQTRSFYTYLTDYPSFEYSSDYKVVPLQTNDEREAKDSTWVVVDREAAKHLIDKRDSCERLNLSREIVDTVRCLLAPLYEDIADWERYFGEGMRNLVSPVFDVDSNLVKADITLTGLANMVIRLSGKNKWRFCCILLPKSTVMPLQQRSLVVRAQSKRAPHKVGVTTVTPGKSINSLSLRAFQSGHTVYKPKIVSDNSTMAYFEVEGSIRSALAIPISGEGGQPMGSLYIASDQEEAFPKSSERVLRVVVRMIEELLLIYQARLHVTDKLINLIERPDVVDPYFENFLSENDFTLDVEKILTTIKNQKAAQLIDEKLEKWQMNENVVSFIAIDIDNQSRYAHKYGDQMVRYLNRSVGRRIQGEMRSFFKEQTDCKLYHIYADRFYIMLEGMSLDRAREKAENLRMALQLPYHIDFLHLSAEQPKPSTSMLTIQDVTVRLSITSYFYRKLEEVLLRYEDMIDIPKVRAIIYDTLDEGLSRGMDAGGNVIFSWDLDKRGFVNWTTQNKEI